MTDGDGERGGCHGHVQKMMEMDRNGHDHTVMFRKMMEMEMERKRGRDLRLPGHTVSLILAVLAMPF